MFPQDEINAFLGRLASKVATTMGQRPSADTLQHESSFNVARLIRSVKDLTATALTTSISEYSSAVFSFLQRAMQVALEAHNALVQLIFLLETPLGVVMEEPSVRVALGLLYAVTILVVLHLLRSIVNFIRDLLDTARFFLLLPVRSLRFIVALALRFLG